jgi:hypothetical protein
VLVAVRLLGLMRDFHERVVPILLTLLAQCNSDSIRIACLRGIGRLAAWQEPEIASNEGALRACARSTCERSEVGRAIERIRQRAQRRTSAPAPHKHSG